MRRAPVKIALPSKVVASIAVASLLSAGLLTACSSSSPSEIASNYPTPTTVAPTTSAGPSQPTGTTDVDRAALAVTDMPAGWTLTTNALSVSIGEAGCLKKAQQRTSAKTSHYVTFAGAGGVPVISESLASFPKSKIVDSYNAAVKTMTSCKTLAIPADSVTFTGPVVTTSAPTAGDASHAFTITATAKGHVLTEYVILGRAGSILFMTTYATVKTPVISDFLTVTATAAKKIKG